MKKNIIVGVILLVLFCGISLYLYINKKDKDLEDKKMDIINNISNNTTFNFERQFVKLNSGYDMPILGLGTWTQNNEETEKSVYQALKDGYRLIDTAQYYGNEKGVGDGLRKALDEGIVTREEVFITTKIMPSSYNNAYNSIDESLRKINIDYIDLLLIHQPGSNDEAVYKAMERSNTK